MGKFIFILILFFIVSLLSFYKIHGSSIGMYNRLFFGTAYQDKDLLFGVPRDVRSDEWMVTTPLTISQTKIKFDHINNFLGLGQEMSILLDTPTNHWSTFFKPYNWSFFFLPLENAFAFRWWFRGALLILSVYLLATVFTGKNHYISITSALVVFFSPFVQWWYSGSAGAGGVETISYGSLAVYSLIKVLEAKNKLSTTVYTFTLAYFSIAYILIYYPPFQISAGLFFLFLIVGYLLNNFSYLDKEKIQRLAVSLGLTLTIIFTVLFFYYLDFKDILKLILNTTYPGAREITGGNYSIIRFFSGYFNILNTGNSPSVPQIFTNKSEASSFFFLYPFLLPIIITRLIYDWFKRRKIDFILVLISLYLLISTIWVLLGLPKFISHLLLLNVVPENRMILGIGLANMFLAIHYLSNYQPFHIKITRILAIVASLVASITHIFVALYLQSNEYFYVRSNYLPFLGTSAKLILIILVVYFSVFLLINRHSKLFMLLILTYSVFSTATVNPLYKGLSPITNSQVVHQLRKATTDNSLWIVYNDLFLPQLLEANGLKTISGVMLYPNFNIWQKFDPSGKHVTIYNRYAHVVYSQRDGEKIDFKLLASNYFRVNINPCHKVLKELNVKYYIFNSPVSYPCLNLIKSIDNLTAPIYLFEKLEEKPKTIQI